MNETMEIKIYCVNDKKYHTVPQGISLMEFSKQICTSVTDPKTGAEYEVLAALVDHKLKELDYRIIMSHEVEFIGYNHPDGRRTYIRSVCFVLQNAVRELYPEKVLVIDHSLPSGLYCEICEQEKLDDGRQKIYLESAEELENIGLKMREIVSRDLPFRKVKMNAKDAEKLFIANNQPDKAELQKSLGKFICSVYFLDGQGDTFHGPLLPSTGYLKVFGLTEFSNGFCLQFPSDKDFNKVVPMQRQSKIAATLKEYSDWCAIIGINGIGTLNKAIFNGKAVELINLSEALHERKYAAIADQIYQRRGKVKIIFIAGPSSSGKTSSSLRLALQCKVLGLNPKVIELDNYFVDRKHTPKDENGEYDFESLNAMDLKFLNDQLNDLLEGKKVKIPKYDFKTGVRSFEGKTMQLDEKDILIMEGIHALDPDMVPEVDNSRIFRVYASALTSLNIDENNNISTSDNRLLRRMVRDNRTRGITPEETINRWHSVRKGENHNIFPFQENADAPFNSALIYELPMLKYYAEPLLRRISPASAAYSEAIRLLKFLDYIVALSPNEITAIPPTSIMREFIGGQTL
ncbi:MAG: nucleoside kinase [Bacteroidales bacterium]|jgi:uridine kinase|nr:nucleoside kinase [Bacteroidales bacterium]